MRIDTYDQRRGAAYAIGTLDPLDHPAIYSEVFPHKHVGLANNDPVSTAHQGVAGGPVLTGTTTTRMLYKTAAGGYPAHYLGDGVDDFFQGVQADWNYLHQRGPWTKKLLMWIPAGVTGTHALFDSNGTGSGNVGITLYCDAATGAIGSFISGGAGNIVGFFPETADCGPKRLPVIITMIGTIGGRVAARGWINGVALHVGHGALWTGTLPSAGSPPASTYAWRLGKSGTDTFPSALPVGGMWDFKGVLTSEESEAIDRHICTALDLELPQQVIADDGGYDTYPTRLLFGGWHHRYWLRQRGHLDTFATYSYGERSKNGRDWVERRRLATIDDVGGTELMAAVVGRSANGTIWASGELVDSSATYMQRSIDGGYTWIDANELDFYGGTTTHLESPILDLASGSIGAAIYTAGSVSPAKFITNSGSGGAWTDAGTIGTVGVPGAECALVRRGNRPVAILSVLGDTLHAVEAANDAGTGQWGTPVDLGFGINGRPHALVNAAGDLIIAYRDAAAPQRLMVRRLSAANFATSTYGSFGGAVAGLDGLPGFMMGVWLSEDPNDTGTTIVDSAHEMGASANWYSEAYSGSIRNSLLAQF